MSVPREAFSITLADPVEKGKVSLHSLSADEPSSLVYLIFTLLLKSPMGKLKPNLQPNFTAELLQET